VTLVAAACALARSLSIPRSGQQGQVSGQDEQTALAFAPTDFRSYMLSPFEMTFPLP